MFDKLPELIDPLNLVNHNKHIVARVNQGRFKRLSELVVDHDREVDVELDFFYDKTLKMPAFNMKLETSLNLQCQRSLEAFDYPVKSEIKGVIVESTVLAEDVPDDVEIFELVEEKVSLPEWVEDELLLCVPLAPVKEGSSMEYENASESTTDEENELEGSTEGSSQKPNPFAVLQGLKK
ncbi:YceD family protein [Thiomicrorhabdus sp. ZW0627]|uniref:YceD family protein n=1 Tax=Thiomicrorhabdus sp. ZW0627 TaxID=3039774 RepID=UPI002436B693|nr:YceD family protein [Thiomicrorhabdus sp. ZW0627]MDG6774636.1 YceD family protein [Thiomicrorhabdus sp. ZW0627]